MIGLGLSDEKDISVRGLECVAKASHIFVEKDSLLSAKRLSTFFQKEVVVVADHIMIEHAKKEEVAYLVQGDPLGREENSALYFKCLREGIHV